jgi:L-amino acid N-acyltransferase YncA
VSAQLDIRLGTPDDAAGVARLINAVVAEGALVLLTGSFSDEEERAFLEDLAPRGGFHIAAALDADDAPAMVAAPANVGSPSIVAAPPIVAAQVFAPYAASMPAHDHVAVMGTWVAARWRRRGLGRALWERTSAAARERGFTRVFTDLRADNVDSLAYHLALGFSVAGVARAQAVIGGHAYDVVFIERGL